MLPFNNWKLSHLSSGSVENASETFLKCAQRDSLSRSSRLWTLKRSESKEPRGKLEQPERNHKGALNQLIL